MIEETSVKNRVIEESELLKKLNTRNVLWAVIIIVLSVLPFIIYQAEIDCHMAGCIINVIIAGIAITLLVAILITLIFVIIFEFQLIKRIGVFEREDLKWLKLKIVLKKVKHLLIL